MRARLGFLTASAPQIPRSQSQLISSSCPPRCPMPEFAFNAALCQARRSAQVNRMDRAPASGAALERFLILVGQERAAAAVLDTPLLSSRSQPATTLGVVLQLACSGLCAPNICCHLCPQGHFPHRLLPLTALSDSLLEIPNASWTLSRKLYASCPSKTHPCS